jgi:hypothetical protein
VEAAPQDVHPSAAQGLPPPLRIGLVLQRYAVLLRLLWCRRQALRYHLQDAALSGLLLASLAAASQSESWGLRACIEECHGVIQPLAEALETSMGRASPAVALHITRIMEANHPNHNAAGTAPR